MIMKKVAVYCRVGTERQIDNTENIEAQKKQFLEKIENNQDLKEFKSMLQIIKHDDLKTVIMLDRERIDDDDNKVYLMCKLAEENGIEIQFINEKITSKDIIKEFEEKITTGMEMNL